MEQALTGVRVLDLSQGVAGPYCAKLLADFGADVIKIEPPAGDYVRGLGPFPEDMPNPEKSGLFLWLNLNKRGITLDVFTPTGRELLTRLTTQADVLVSSVTPAQLEALGLTYEQLAVTNPALVVAAITPWGLSGPYRDYTASEIALDAWGHSMYSFGTRDREPLTAGGNVRQYFAGQVAALATLAARLSAEQSGRGQTLDLAMMEAQLGNIDRRSVMLQRYQYTGKMPLRPDPGSSIGNLQGGYHPCKDGWIQGGRALANFEGFARLLQHPEWLSEPRFQPIAVRFLDPEIHDEIETAFLLWLQERSCQEVAAAARQHQVRLMPVNTVADVLDDEQLLERQFWLEVPHPVAGTLRYPGAAFKLGEGGHVQRLPAPTLGQHNAEVYCGQLGLTAQELSQLSAQGVITAATAVTMPAATVPGDVEPLARRHVEALPLRLPLEGVRILDLTVVWAGPFATELLGDLGAEVIRIESLQHFPLATRGHVVRPTREDLQRMHAVADGYVDNDPGERPWNRFANFNVSNRNKRSMTVNLGSAEGIAIARRLVTLSDVVIDNSSHGAMERLGLGYEALRRINPQIIQLSMPLFGNSGPYIKVDGMGSTIDAFAGFAALRGYRGEGVSMTQPVWQMDAVSGVAAAFAVLCALRVRGRTGQGQFIDLSQTETVLHQAGEYLLDVQLNGRVPVPAGNRDSRGAALQGCYPCQEPDSWIVVTLRSDADWAHFCEALEQPAWCREEQYRTMLSRLAHHDAFDAALAAWTVQRSAKEAMTQLQRAGVTAAQVMNDRDVFADEHLQARGYFIRLLQPDSGTHLYPGPLWKSSTSPLCSNRAAPNLGQDNEYVYQCLLGYGATEYERLRQEQQVGEAYLEGVGIGRLRG